MRLRGLLIIIALAAGGYLLVSRHHRDASPPARSAPLATSTHPPGAPDPSPRAAKERVELGAIADEMELDDHERIELLSAQSDFQSARLALFDDLAARRINAEQVSAQLHVLRAELNARIEAALGHERALHVAARMRDSHRGQ